MNSFLNKHLNLIVFVVAIVNLIIIFITDIHCPWKNNFNIECPGCGATRMVKAMINLDFYQAFRFNPLIFCLLVVLIVYFIYVLICKIKRIDYYKIQNRDYVILIIIILLFGIVRNIKGLEFLKPTYIR